MPSPFDEVQTLLSDYFELLYHCDLRLFDTVFHPDALYASADETPFLQRDMPTYREVIATRQSPASRREPRQDVIDSIEFAGDNTAFARVRCAIGSRQFVDFLTLVRVNDRWQIIAKVFQIIEKKDS